MISNQKTNSREPTFSKLPPSEARAILLEKLLGSIEKCLLSFWGDLQKMYPELAAHEGTIIERFYNAGFSHFFQIAVSDIGLAGYFTYHDECSNPIDLLERKKKKGLARQVDLGIRLQHSRDRILVIEGKRLYSKTDKQYVSGKTGGICRFKREQHGNDLNTACIIGFVEKEVYDFWQSLVNQWILEELGKATDLCWGSIEDEKVSADLRQRSKSFRKYISTNQRLTRSPLNLYHFWVKVY